MLLSLVHPYCKDSNFWTRHTQYPVHAMEGFASKRQECTAIKVSVDSKCNGRCFLLVHLRGCWCAASKVRLRRGLAVEKTDGIHPTRPSCYPVAALRLRPCPARLSQTR
eukprot:3622843-Amphidinium_carterae.1